MATELESRGLPQENRPNQPDRAIQQDWYQALTTDQYEIAEHALSDITAFRNWRNASQASSFPDFFGLAEAASALNKIQATAMDRSKVVEQLTVNSVGMSPRVRDLYLGLLAEVDGSAYTPQFPMTEQQLVSLKESGDLALLQDPAAQWELKVNRMQTRLETELKARKALDRRDKERTVEQDDQTRKRDDQTTPPPDRDYSKPGMDEMERLKEGEQASAIWTIHPAWGGYYKEQSFDVWDPHTNLWRRRSNTEGRAVDPTPRQSNAAITISARVPEDQWTRIPLPYRYAFDGINADASEKLVVVDENGDYLFKVGKSNSGTTRTVTIELADKGEIHRSEKVPEHTLTFPGQLTDETEAKVAEVGRTRRTNVEKARALASYTMRRLTYSNDSSYNSTYEQHQNGYIGGIDELKQADCDVANTYFAALVSKLNIPVRHVVGHMVKGKDDQGNARITSGTGHAWSEVWDEVNHTWQRIDATPPGDPQQEQEQNEMHGMPGDYGEQEAIGPTEEELAKLQEQLRELTESLSYTQDERELSEATGIALSEARSIVREIQEAENIRLPNGERLVDVMSQMWSLIREARSVKTQDFTGPLRKREGGEEIEYIVDHKIGIQSGDLDPVSRQKDDTKTTVEEVLHTMELYVSGDKSGSMGHLVDGETKWSLQRRAEYLLFSSLDREQKNVQRVAARMVDPLAYRTMGISFRGSADDEIDVDKPLSSEFSLTDKVKLWHSLTNQGWGNGDVPALEFLLQTIRTEKARLLQEGKKDDTLRVVIACSDGEPDSIEGVHQLARALGEEEAVVVGIGMTETAAKVPLIFTTPYSQGDFAKDINDLPVIIAKHVITQATNLFPQRTRQSYARATEAILAKFNAVGIR